MKRDTSHTFRHDLAGTISAPQTPLLLSALRELRLPAVLAALALGALCLAFLEVVSGAVEQGQVRRDAQLNLADATWRCNAQRDRLLRTDCQVRLGVVAGAGQTLANGGGLATADLRSLP